MEGRQLGLGRVVERCRVVARHRDRARHAVLRGDLQKLREHLAHLLLGHGAREQRHRLAAQEGDHHRDGLRAEGLGELRIGVDVDLGQHDASGEFQDDAFEDRTQLLARPAPVGPEVDHDGHRAREFEHLAERLVGDVHDERCDDAVRLLSVGGRGPRAGCGGPIAQGRQIDGTAQHGARAGLTHFLITFAFRMFEA